MNRKINALSIIVLLTIGLLVSFVSFSAFDLSKTKHTQPTALVLSAEFSATEDNTNTMPEEMYGINTAPYNVVESTVKKNEFLSTILERHHVDAQRVAELATKSKPVFNVKNLAAGKKYSIFTPKNNPEKISFFVYHPNAVETIVYDLRDSIGVNKLEKEVETRIETVAGSIDGSLYEALRENGGDPDMAVHLANIFGGVINFYSIKKGDWFKIKYESSYVGEELLSSGKIQSAVFSHNGKEYEAHYFQAEGASEGAYYDAEGNSLRRSFLKAPLKFSRISSRFSKRRLHPVQRVYKAHLGTDYAAPNGTPIIATGDGVVTDSRFTKANGNYVKIKHNKTYSTQYLHMSRRAVRPGQRIKQGQVIGYVGSTGLATGPHVCYRFWKDGKQVDPLRQNFKMAIPIASQHLQAFHSVVEKTRIEFATLSTTKAEEPEQVVKVFEERPANLFRYFSSGNSDNT